MKAIRSGAGGRAASAGDADGDYAPATARDEFRAYDKATGAVVWEIELPAGMTGAPITYMFEGKQYIIVPIGGRKHPGEFVAFSLP